MRFWIEVTGDYQWQLRLNGHLGLNVPAATRYKNMLCNIEKGDIVLHHIAIQRAEIVEHYSSIVGLSKIKSEMYTIGKKLLVDLEGTLELPFPIKFKDYSHIERPSEKFKFLLHTNLQKYILEIDKSDLIKILELKKEDLSYVKQFKSYSSLF